ncbi:hypothetical protein [Candidatus Nitrotoga sp. AM1P]|nr:hypothetical protein [Candidatus Nitrotoga sp. AM1P]
MTSTLHEFARMVLCDMGALEVMCLCAAEPGSGGVRASFILRGVALRLC